MHPVEPHESENRGMHEYFRRRRVSQVSQQNQQASCQGFLLNYNTRAKECGVNRLTGIHTGQQQFLQELSLVTLDSCYDLMTDGPLSVVRTRLSHASMTIGYHHTISLRSSAIKWTPRMSTVTYLIHLVISSSSNYISYYVGYHITKHEAFPISNFSTSAASSHTRLVYETKNAPYPLFPEILPVTVRSPQLDKTSLIKTYRADKY